MAGAGNWCLIESDPGVFSELINEFGCSGLQVEELWSLDSANFEDLKPVHGLIFLFKWRPGEEAAGSVVSDDRLDSIYFAQQVIQNACATQAIINLLLNLPTSSVSTLGDVLSSFKSFTDKFDSQSRGLALSNSEQIRGVHNSFARQQVFDISVKLPEDEDVYHYVAYVPIDGRVYELDGLKTGPIDLGRVEANQDWLDVVRPILEKRMERYSSDGFNLMAVISDRRQVYQQRVVELSQDAENAESVAAEVYRLQSLIDDEDAKFKRYKAENARRRHNYIPFIIELLKVLAKEGKLVPLIEQAQNKAKEKADAEKTKTDEKTMDIS